MRVKPPVAASGSFRSVVGGVCVVEIALDAVAGANPAGRPESASSYRDDADMAFPMAAGDLNRPDPAPAAEVRLVDAALYAARLVCRASILLAAIVRENAVAALIGNVHMGRTFPIVGATVLRVNFMTGRDDHVAPARKHAHASSGISRGQEALPSAPQ